MKVLLIFFTNLPLRWKSVMKRVKSSFKTSQKLLVKPKLTPLNFWSSHNLKLFLSPLLC